MSKEQEEQVKEMLAFDKHRRLNAMKSMAYLDRTAPHRAALPHHAAYGSVLRGSADQAGSDPGEQKKGPSDLSLVSLLVSF